MQRRQREEGRAVDAGPDIEHHHHHHTGRVWVDMLLGVSAVAISFISLFLAVENGHAMQRLVQANSWPFVNIGVSNGDPDGNYAFALVIQNKGIGPAKVETLEVFYRDKPMSDDDALVHAMLGPRPDLPPNAFVNSTVTGDVLSSKEELHFLAANSKVLSAADMKSLSEGSQNIRFRFCYCSVFDECWLADHTVHGRLPPKPVKSCPAPRTPFTG
jgi:hypothetical protein